MFYPTDAKYLNSLAKWLATHDREADPETYDSVKAEFDELRKAARSTRSKEIPF